MSEKVEGKKSLVEILSTTKAKYIIGTVLYTGLGITLPRIFHLLAGASSGATFLPMHIAVLLASLTFGVLSGSIVAGASVLFSYLLTGMPAVARLPYMMIELVIYAVLLGLFNKKFNSYISLIATMILGRVLYAGVLFTAVNLIGLNGYGISVIESVKAGIPGLIIQLLFVPVIAYGIKKGIHLDD